MFTLKYKPDQYGPMAVLQFANGWNRIRKSAASYHHKWSEHVKNAAEHDVRIDRYYLNSYAAPIAYVVVFTDNTDEKKSITLFLNEDMWQYSRTTIRHFSDFLRMLAFFHGAREVTYQLVKHVMNSKRLKNFHDGPLIEDSFTSSGYEYFAYLIRCNNKTMQALFADTPKITCEIIY